MVSSSSVNPKATAQNIAESSVGIDHKGHSTLMRHHHRDTHEGHSTLMRHHHKHTHKPEELKKEKESVEHKTGQEIRSPIDDTSHMNHHPHASTHHKSEKTHHPHHHALRVHQHEAAEFGVEPHRPSPLRQVAEEKVHIRLADKTKEHHKHSHKKILPSSNATTLDGKSYSIANGQQMCHDNYEPIEDLLDCQTAMTAFGAEWAEGEPCSGGPKGCSIRRDLLAVVSWVDTPSKPDEKDFPRCNILCKKTSNSMLEIDSEPEGPSVSATCPDGFAREFGDSEPEWGDMVLGSYWGARHAENIETCAGQCNNVTDCMSFKWSPNFLQGAVPQHPCILTLNEHITTNSTFHDFIFCAKMPAETLWKRQGGNILTHHPEEGSAENGESGDAKEESSAQEEFLYAQTGNEGRRMLKKDSRQDFASKAHESSLMLGSM